MMLTACLIGVVLTSATPAAASQCGLSIRVEDRDTSAPISGAEIRIIESEVDDQRGAEPWTCGDDGTARIHGLDPGQSYDVYVDAPTYERHFSRVVCEPDRPAVIVSLKTRTDVSLIELIANPNRWHGRQVRVIGFLDLEFEGNALYLSKDAWKNDAWRNAVWVNPSADMRADRREIDRRYVEIEGTFDANDAGHMGHYSGTIDRITAYRRWNGRE